MDTKKGYYNVLLALIDKLFEGDIDQQTFEESVRYIFGADAYILFTIDKLVLSLVRHVKYNHILYDLYNSLYMQIHIIITDTHSQELFDIFSTEHRAEQLNQGDVMTYRTKIMSTLDPAENIYHITFVRN
jgi:paired amphipathic helix protein Sin3a